MVLINPQQLNGPILLALMQNQFYANLPFNVRLTLFIWWEAPQIVKDYLQSGDEKLRVTARGAVWSAREAAWDSAREAERDSAREAARGAARDSAWEAARGAAWEAARGAAWEAARGAAREAARGAAWGAEWSAARGAALKKQKAILEKMILKEIKKVKV